MRRRTITAATAALTAVATIGLINADRGVAFAQEADLAFSTTSPDQPLTTETVPVFVSREIVQPLPQPAGEPEQASDSSDISVNSLRELVARSADAEPLSEEMRCLAGAVYFESRGEPLAGQLAVAKVVINRKHSPRFPDSYCGVVYQRSQFSFVKNGRMPRIREDSSAWREARAIARIAHRDHWDSEADDALYFHADYVKPGWAKRRVAAATINRHIFYR